MSKTHGIDVTLDGKVIKPSTLVRFLEKNNWNLISPLRTYFIYILYDDPEDFDWIEQNSSLYNETLEMIDAEFKSGKSVGFLLVKEDKDVTLLFPQGAKTIKIMPSNGEYWGREQGIIDMNKYLYEFIEPIKNIYGSLSSIEAYIHF